MHLQFSAIYKVTLLSNHINRISYCGAVLEIYRITLLSNHDHYIVIPICSFGDLQNYTTLKLNELPVFKGFSFGDLQNYTTLKHPSAYGAAGYGFGDLQNYTTLKP